MTTESIHTKIHTRIAYGTTVAKALDGTIASTGTGPTGQSQHGHPPGHGDQSVGVIRLNCRMEVRESIGTQQESRSIILNYDVCGSSNMGFVALTAQQRSCHIHSYFGEDIEVTI
jgi:hypothetical protein